MNHRGLNPHARHPTGLRECPERILEAARRDPEDRVLAIAARCIQCIPSAEGVRSCERRSCALWRLRPYRLDAPPRSAPHLERPEPTYEKEPETELEEA